MNVRLIALLLILVGITIAGYMLLPDQKDNQQTFDFWSQSNESNTSNIDHRLWQDILENYIDTEHDTGVYMFDYGSIEAEEVEQLKTYIDHLSALDPRQYNKVEQKAYWINFYNALTVKLILDHYPVESITDLGNTVLAFGPWDDELVHVEGQALSLNDIEHAILRPIWRDSRIHFAVNCASYGCPNLQDNAFTSENMEALLEKAAREYLVHDRGLRFDEGQLILSSIFDWYGEDFGANQKEVLLSLSEYLGDDLRQQLINYQGSIEYEYSWLLNDSELFE